MLMWHSPGSPSRAGFARDGVEEPPAVRKRKKPQSLHIDFMKDRKYQYRRNLPHIERSTRAHFVTFTTHLRWQLPPPARDLVLRHCLHDHGRKMRLYIAVVMPDHVTHALYASGKQAQPDIQFRGNCRSHQRRIGPFD